ncbi:hypothetical protein V2I01_26945 [Micromonospora sp. BRA006-A]|nr:hypothetical protein [Micromonospora sp. BRA006-A]
MASSNQPFNTNTGLTQVGARNYDPTTGRFVSWTPPGSGEPTAVERLRVRQQLAGHDE